MLGFPDIALRIDIHPLRIAIPRGEDFRASLLDVDQDRLAIARGHVLRDHMRRSQSIETEVSHAEYERIGVAHRHAPPTKMPRERRSVAPPFPLDRKTGLRLEYGLPLQQLVAGEEACFQPLQH